MSTLANKQEEYTYQRRFIRHPIRLEIEVHHTQVYTSWTQNISEDGVCFHLPFQLAIGREVEVWLYLNNKQEETPIRSRCRIVWHSQDKKEVRHGGHFLFFLNNGKEILGNFLKNQ